jgi:CHAD domain-containing protein
VFQKYGAIFCYFNAQTGETFEKALTFALTATAKNRRLDIFRRQAHHPPAEQNQKDLLGCLASKIGY